MHTNRRSCNDKSYCALFLINFVSQSEFAEQNYDIILDTLTAYDFPWECSLMLCLPIFSSFHIPTFITQKWSISKLKYWWDKWRWRNIALLRSTDTRWRIILTTVPNLLSRLCVSELSWKILILVQNFFLLTLSKIDILQRSKKWISNFEYFYCHLEYYRDLAVYCKNGV